MSLNSPTFLFLFLPIFLLIFTLIGKRLRVYTLILFSVIFLLWSDPLFAPFIFTLVVLNFILLTAIQKVPTLSSQRSHRLNFSIGINLFALLAFKIISTYGQDFLSWVELSQITIPQWVVTYLPLLAHLPLGLSFLTFQAISMLVDGSRQDNKDEISLLSVSNYLLLFPKLISGPILRFHETAAQLKQPSSDPSQVADGVRRFMLGFIKKTMVADQLALITDRGIFNQAPANIPPGVAWLIILCYTLQIYIDFSSYSDMAIGLGQVLGFRFPENFNFPYISASISEFWRRWHMTLSNWFRDYVFYPLERKRRVLRWLTQPVNILLVFLLTGLWHGITPPFIVWGLLHGLAIAIEHTRIGNWQRSLWKPIQNMYTLSVIIVGWVFFRSSSLAYAWNFIKSLFGFNHPLSDIPFSVLPPISPFVWAALVISIFLSFPVLPALQKRFSIIYSFNERPWLGWCRDGLLLGLFALGIMFQAGTSYQPFLYGGF